MLCQLSYGHQAHARFYQEREGSKNAEAHSEGRQGSLGSIMSLGSQEAILARRSYSPQPKNSVFLSSFFPSSTTRKILDGLGFFIITMLPLAS